MPQPDPSPARSRSPGTATQAVGDRAAAWLRDHLDAVYRYARRRLSADDADDVVQQSFEALFRAERDGRAPDDAGAYLFGVARRRIADLLRRRARRPEPVALPPGWEGIEQDRLPDESLATEEMQSLVAIAYGLLPGPDALVLQRRYRDGQPVVAIADELGVTPKAVEMRLRRARAAFLGHFRRVGRDWIEPSTDPAEGGA